MQIKCNVLESSRLDLKREKYRFNLLVMSLVFILLVSMIVSVGLGPVFIDTRTVWDIIFNKITGANNMGNWTQVQENIVWTIRLPRIILGGLVGAGLALTGVTMQALVRNHLADPYILGVASGASTTATLSILFGAFSIFGQYALSVSAFIGAGFSIVIVYVLSRVGGKIQITQLLLSGVAISMVMSATTNLITMLAPNTMGLKSAQFWLLGSLAGSRWSYLSVPAVVIISCMIYLVIHYRTLNAMLMGDEAAKTLGVDISKFQKMLILVTSLLAGAIIAVSGSIGFVGLMIPHITRLIIGSDHAKVLPISSLLGGIFIIWMDVIARIVIAPEELPIGIITAFCGGPFFIWLLRRNARN